MNLDERKQKLDYLLEMIEKERCYTINDTAKRLNCSNSTIDRMIKKLRDDGFNIRYCKHDNKYKIN
jgi:predicted transcriptional regulator